MISPESFITVTTGYKKASELTLGDILYDPKDKVQSAIKKITEPVQSTFYRVKVMSLYPIECTNDVYILTDVGFMKPQDLCPRCRVKTPIGFLPVMASVPISEQRPMMKIIPEKEDFLIVVNGAYLAIEDK